MVELRELDETASDFRILDFYTHCKAIFRSLYSSLQVILGVCVWLVAFLKSLISNERYEHGQKPDTASATERRLIQFQGTLRNHDNDDDSNHTVTVPDEFLYLFNAPEGNFKFWGEAMREFPLTLFSSPRRVIYKPSETYEEIIAELIRLEDNGDFDEFNNYLSSIVKLYADNDPDIVSAVTVEHAQCMIYQNQLGKARRLARTGLEWARHTTCPPLFQARGHIVMSSIYKKEKKFGFCEEHLRLAEQNLKTVSNYEDLAHFHECYGSFMYKFIGSVPHNDENLQKKAMDSFKKMFDVSSKDKRDRVRDKNHFYALIKISKTLLDSNSSFGRCKRTVSKEDLVLAEKCLGTIKKTLWKNVPRGSQIQFMLVTSDLYFRKGKFDEALRLQERCLGEAKKHGFKTEEPPIIQRMQEIKQLQSETVPVIKEIEDRVTSDESTTECSTNRASGNDETSENSDAFKSDFL